MEKFTLDKKYSKTKKKFLYQSPKAKGPLEKLRHAKKKAKKNNALFLNMQPEPV